VAKNPAHPVGDAQGGFSSEPRRPPAADYYESAVRQFTQQILPNTLPPTTVWGYGAVTAQGNNRW
jgi:spore coat protein A, manganese oxidase